MTLPNYDDVLQAAKRLDGVALKTPVVRSYQLNERVGAEVFLKCESFQRTGSFKFRGATNALRAMPEEVRQRGVLAFSSGNHAQGVALAGQQLGIPVTVVMPRDAIKSKIEAARAYGAEVVLFDRSEVSREALGKQICEERGLTVVKPYDDPYIVAGQGTSAKELFEKAGELDALVVCVGGGGVLSGSALSAAELSPNCKVFGAEPAGADDAVRSFRSGSIQTCEDPQTICDGARTPFIGQINFAIIQDKVTDIVPVSDAEVLRTMRFLYERVKLVVEPTGCLAVAALLSGAVRVEGKVGAIVTGGNVDLDAIGDLMAQAPPID